MDVWINQQLKQNKEYTDLAGGGGASGDSRSMESTLGGVTCDSELEEASGSMAWSW
jgi:hypothetical protein